MNYTWVLLLIPSLTFAEPLVTISCTAPKGHRVEYGASARERVQAENDRRPEPKPHLKGPTEDGYSMTPTFIVDSRKRKLTVVWSESAADAEHRTKAKELGVPYCCSPPAATDAEIVLFAPDQIAALQVMSPNGVKLYSFFPKLGVAFVSSQSHELSGKNTEQLSFFSTCEFAWARSK